MPRIIVTAQGTKGDIHPLIGLARQLVRRGHRTTMLANSYFQGPIEEAGLEFQSVGLASDYEQAFATGLYETGGDAKFNAVYKGCFEKSIEPVYRYIEQHRHSREPLIVVCPHYFDSAALMACTKYSIPAVQVVLAPAQLGRTLCWPYNQLGTMSRRLVYRPMAQWQFFRSRRRRLHAQWERRLDSGTRLSSLFHRHQSRATQLALFPRWFLDDPYETPEQRRLCIKNEPFCTGFPLHDPTDASARQKVDGVLAGRAAPIVFTAGTGIKNVDNFFEVSKAICERLSIPGLFVNSDAESLRPLSSELLRVVDYVDFSYLLSKARAIVHHGGVGTCAQAIRAGIPQIVRPLEYDQPDNGWRVTRLGVGGMILRDDYQIDVGTEYVRRIIHDPEILRRAREYAGRCPDDALELAARRIEEEATGERCSA